MHQALSAAELAEIKTKHPVRPMTKQEKLLAWADLIDRFEGWVWMYSNLEHWREEHLADPEYGVNCRAVTAVTLACRHEPFQAEGIGESVSSALKFFELTKEELHQFSCDCGGRIDNKTQALAIRSIAGK